MTNNCMKNAKKMNDFYYEEFENKGEEISISMELVRLILSSKGSNTNKDMIEELKSILSCDFIEDDCIKFEKYLKGEGMKKCKSCGREFDEIKLKDGLCETCCEFDLKQQQFEELTKPFIKFIAENFHPHTHVIINSKHAELSEGVMVIETEEFLKG